MARKGPTPVWTSAKKKLSQSSPRSVGEAGVVAAESFMKRRFARCKLKTVAWRLPGSVSEKARCCRRNDRLYVLQSSNYLDTHAAGSYNRRPLSPGTSAGQTPANFKFMHPAALLLIGRL